MMNSMKKVETFTVQRRDTSVPVGEGSERAGSPRPSSFDCPMPLVKSQTGEHSIYTGLRKKLELIIPQQRVSSSAPVTPTRNYATLDLTWDEEDCRSKKRKVTDPLEKEVVVVMEDRSGIERLAVKARKIIKDLDKETRDLNRVISVNSNTKREIKEIASKLRSMVSQLVSTEMQELLQTLGTQTVRKIEADQVTRVRSNTIERAMQTDAERKKELEENGTQTVDEGTENLAREIEEVRDLDSFKGLTCREWPEEIYQTVKKKTSNPLLSPSDHDVAIVITESSNKERGLFKQFRDRFPEVDEILLGVNDERKDIISVSSRIITRIGNTEKESEKMLYLIDGGEEKDGDIEPGNILGSLEVIGKQMEKRGRKRLALAWDTGGSRDTIRKLAECTFRKTDILVTWCVPHRGVNAKEAAGPGSVKKKAADKEIGREKTAEGKKDTQKGPPKTGGGGRGNRRKMETEAVIVSAHEITYAELLKTVKGKVNLEQLGVQLTAVRRTRKGELLLETSRGSGGAEILRTAIQRELGETSVTARGGRGSLITLHIRGIDGDITQEELAELLRKETGEEKIEVRSLRPAFDGSHNATAIVPHVTGEKLIETGRVKIGWTYCRIEERIALRRCERCWDPRHETRNCTGPNREGLCLKCGKDGHKARECKFPEYCPLCDRSGHRSDSARCPVYSKVLGSLKRRRGLGKKRKNSEADGTPTIRVEDTDTGVKPTGGGDSQDQAPPNG